MNISALARQACTQLDTIDKLENNKRNAADIEATYVALQIVKDKILQLYNQYKLFNNRLEIKSFQKNDITKIQKDMQQLQEVFQHHMPRQVQELRLITSAIQRIQTKINDEWRNYAENLLRSHLELLEIVGSLPEIRAQEASVNGLVNRLKHHISVMPQTESDLQDFDTCLKQLQSHLANLNDLHSDVKEFLQRVRAGKATLADVTDEVLYWCRKGEQAKAFHISF